MNPGRNCKYPLTSLMSDKPSDRAAVALPAYTALVSSASAARLPPCNDTGKGLILRLPTMAYACTAGSATSYTKLIQSVKMIDRGRAIRAALAGTQDDASACANLNQVQRMSLSSCRSPREESRPLPTSWPPFSRPTSRSSAVGATELAQSAHLQRIE